MQAPLASLHANAIATSKVQKKKPYPVVETSWYHPKRKSIQKETPLQNSQAKMQPQKNAIPYPMRVNLPNAISRRTTIARPLPKFGRATLFAPALPHHDDAKSTTGHTASGTRSAIARRLRPRHRINHAPHFAEHADSDGHDRSRAERHRGDDHRELGTLGSLDNVVADG